MKPTSPFTKAFAIVMIIALLAPATALAARVTLEDGIDVKLDDDDIDVGDRFDVEIELQEADDDEEDADIEIAIYIDDVLIHEDEETVDLEEGKDTTVTVNSRRFRVDRDDVWDENLWAYACGTHTIRVHVSGDVDDEEDEDELEIDGEELYVEISPDEPGIGEEITVYVEDEDGDEFRGVSVKVTKLGGNGVWDEDDPAEEDHTDRDGEYVLQIDDIRAFDDEPLEGKYQIDVWRPGYCKYTAVLDVGGAVTVTGPSPADPAIGDTVTFTATTSNGDPRAGVKASLNIDGQLIQRHTTLDGTVSFTVSVPGRYDVVFTGGGLAEEIVTFTVAERDSPTITVNPAAPEAGEEVTVTVTADGSPLAAADVRITQPNGVILAKSTDAQGQASFTPEAPGAYALTAAKDGYQDASATATVREKLLALDIALNPAIPPLGGDVVLTATSDGAVVAGAKVVVSGPAPQSGLTDERGQFAFSVDELGDYRIAAQKEGYALTREEFSLAGELTLHVAPPEPAAGDELAVTVLDERGNEVEALVTVTAADGGVVERERTDLLALTLPLPGGYTVAAEREGYARAVEDVAVAPRPLDLAAALEDGRLTLSATSRGEDVAGLTVTVLGPDGERRTVTTDETGMAAITAKAVGTYRITAESSEFETADETVEREAFNYAWLILAVLGAMMVVLAAAILAVYGMQSRKATTLGKSAKSTKAPKLSRL